MHNRLSRQAQYRTKMTKEGHTEGQSGSSNSIISEDVTCNWTKKIYLHNHKLNVTYNGRTYGHSG